MFETFSKVEFEAGRGYIMQTWCQTHELQRARPKIARLRKDQSFSKISVLEDMAAYVSTLETCGVLAFLSVSVLTKYLEGHVSRLWSP
jgi:hypothetical protein